MMPIYSVERYLAEAIASILGQTNTNVDFIIVNDGSQDKLCTKSSTTHAESDDRICVISLEKNGGQSAAINTGIAASTGKYVTGMDCDDVSLPRRLELQLTFLQANPRVGAVGTQMQVVDDNMKPLFEYDVPEHHARILWNLFFGWSLAGATVMMRRELLVSLGGYDTSYRTAGDLDLWSSMAEITRFANLPGNLYVYRRHAAAIGVDQLERQRKEREWVVNRMLEDALGRAGGRHRGQIHEGPRARNTVHSRRAQAAAKGFAAPDRVLCRCWLGGGIGAVHAVGGDETAPERDSAAKAGISRLAVADLAQTSELAFQRDDAISILTPSTWRMAIRGAELQAAAGFEDRY